MKEELLFAHGGYRRLKTFQLASLVYELTELFVRRYMEPNSRTCDQMIQAARSGMQNIAEGSIDSGTSKKSELHLTNIARGSLEELNNDYRHFLEERNLPVWTPQSPLMMRLRQSRCRDINALRHVAVQLVRELSDGLTESDQSDQSDQSDKGRLTIRQGMSANSCADAQRGMSVNNSNAAQRGMSASNSNAAQQGMSVNNSNAAQRGISVNNSNAAQRGISASNSNAAQRGMSVNNSNAAQRGMSVNNSNAAQRGISASNSNAAQRGMSVNNSNAAQRGISASNSNAAQRGMSVNNSNAAQRGMSASNSNDAQQGMSVNNSNAAQRGMSANNYAKSDWSDWSDWSDKKSVTQTPQTFRTSPDSPQTLSTFPDRPQTPAFPHLTKERIKQTVAANCSIMLISQNCFLLDKQINRLSEDFINNGEFSERLSMKRRNFRPQQ